PDAGALGGCGAVMTAGEHSSRCSPLVPIRADKTGPTRAADHHDVIGAVVPTRHSRQTRSRVRECLSTSPLTCDDTAKGSLFLCYRSDSDESRFSTFGKPKSRIVRCSAERFPLPSGRAACSGDGGGVTPPGSRPSLCSVCTRARTCVLDESLEPIHGPHVRSADTLSGMTFSEASDRYKVRDLS